MPNPSKRKGSHFEREVVSLLASHGVRAERVPLSGAAGGSHTGDVDVLVRNDRGTWNQKKLEAKRRRAGFKTLYSWLGSNYALVFRDDHTEPLVALRLTDFAELIK